MPDSLSKRPGKLFPVVDVFSGVGGLSLGAARAGFHVQAAIELDKEPLRAHTINFPTTLHLRRSARRLSGTELRRLAGMSAIEPFGMIGGPPCQGFSVIGRRDASDPRNRLLVDFFRLVAEARPLFFVAENVPGILAAANTFVREKALGLVNKKYSIIGPLTITANDYGAPTSRERVFYLGFDRNRTGRIDATMFAPPQTEPVFVRDALAGLPVRLGPEHHADGWCKVHVEGDGPYAERLWGHIPPGVGDRAALDRLFSLCEASGNLATRHSPRVAQRYAAVGAGKIDLITKSRRLNSNGFCPTLRAGTGPERGRFQAVRPLHPTEDRVITPREGARLQGFPDWFQFSPTRWHSFRLIGNSVSPLVAESLFSVVRRAIDEEVL